MQHYSNSLSGAGDDCRSDHASHRAEVTTSYNLELKLYSETYLAFPAG